jgi:hypothetical protein
LIVPEISDLGLADLKALRSLKTLDLSDTKIRDAGLSHLAKLPNFGSVRLMGIDAWDSTAHRLARARERVNIPLASTKSEM